MGLRFYISGKWNLFETVKEMEIMIQNYGHEIVESWTSRAYARRYGGENAEQSKEFSERELKGISDSDVLIHLSDVPEGECGKGMYGDLVGGLMSNKLKGNPFYIYILGKNVNESQWYFNKRVTQRIPTNNLLKSLEDILESLK